jgi:hypothetical protein
MANVVPQNDGVVTPDNTMSVLATPIEETDVTAVPVIATNVEAVAVTPEISEEAETVDAVAVVPLVSPERATRKRNLPRCARNSRREKKRKGKSRRCRSKVRCPKGTKRSYTTGKCIAK